MEVLNIIRNSPELMKMVDGINYENEKPRGKRRSKESLAVDKFWFGADRANFYLLLKKNRLHSQALCESGYPDFSL